MTPSLRWIRSTRNVRVAVGLLVALSVAAAWWCFRPGVQEVDLLSKWSHRTYDDREDGHGGSRAELVPSTGLKFAWVLRKGSPWPYAGTVFSPRHVPRADLSSHHHLHLRWRSSHGNPVALLLNRDIPGYTSPDKPSTWGVLRREIVPSLDWSDLDIPLSDFEVPLWWYRGHDRVPDGGPTPLDRILSLSLASGETAKLDLPDTIEVAELRWVASCAHPWLGGILCLSLWGAAISLLFLARPVPVRETVVPEGEPSAIPLRRRELFWNHLANRYRDPELDLTAVAKETGLGEHRIGEILRAQNLTFRTALNEMRLKEALRLLRESELQISEVAWQSGFGNVSHFNRVFKARYGSTPSDIRQGLPLSVNGFAESSETADGKDSPPPEKS